MDNQLIVKNADGKDEAIHVIDIITDNETGKKYLFYKNSHILYVNFGVKSQCLESQNLV